VLNDLFRAFFKVAIVAIVVVVVGGLILAGYRIAFPPSEGSNSATAINIPQIDFSRCGVPGEGSSLDPTDLAYAYQLEQFEDLLDKPASDDKGEVNFIVEEGELPVDVAARLERDGLIENSEAFILLLKCRHAAERIQAGDQSCVVT
jgi:cell division protein YceG involved in septum cleavage